MRIDLDHLSFPGRAPANLRAAWCGRYQPAAGGTGRYRGCGEAATAVDAALATAITLTVVEPASNGMGGDAFALVWDGSRLHGINGSGRAPAALSRRSCAAGPYQHAGQWLADGHGSRCAGALAGPAPALWPAAVRVTLRDGHRLCRAWLPRLSYFALGLALGRRETHATLDGEEFSAFLPLFAPEGRAPRVGEIWRSAEMARSLRLIAETEAAAFYRGELAERCVEFAGRTGGCLTDEDFARHTSTWVEPIHTSYRGFDVYEMPPNGQGLAALIALNILEGFDLGSIPRDSAESYHRQLEAMKLAFADAQRYIGDPEHGAVYR